MLGLIQSRGDTMEKMILFFLLPTSSIGSLETSYKYLEISGNLAPAPKNWPPLGEIKQTLSKSIHGSLDDVVLRSIIKNAQEHLYDAQHAHLDAKKQCDFINKRFDITKEQIKYLQEERKKLKANQHKKIAQIEMDLYMRQLEVCSLHMAIMVARGDQIFRS